jgi:hypothetical protein
VLRNDPIRVRVVISTAPRFDWAAYPNLDPAKPDDQLVAEALSFGNGAAIFSYDAGPRIRARIARIEAYEPAAEWLLPVEQTDDQRKITKLERDLKQALSQRPTIVARFENFDEATSEIRAIQPIVPPLDPEQVDRLTRGYLKKHPRASFGSRSNSRMAWQLGTVSEDEVQQHTADYGAFELSVHNYYARLHEIVQRVGAAVAIDYHVRNDSSEAAHGLRIEFNLEGNGSLLAEREQATGRYRNSFKAPEPPDKPRSVFDGLTSPIANFPTLSDHLAPRDPVGFYWFERPKLVSAHSASQCQEFRATRHYSDSIFVLPLDELPTELGLRLHISAGNLPSPVNILAKIIITNQAAEWSAPVVQAILPENIRNLL